MRNDYNITRAFELKNKKNWEYIYIALDLHGTIIPERTSKEDNFTFFPNAAITLKEMSEREDIKLILFTGSTNTYIKKFLKVAKEKDIHFDFINENTEVNSSDRESFCAKSKLYFNVLLDDRAGFEGKDWKDIRNLLKTLK